MGKPDWLKQIRGAGRFLRSPRLAAVLLGAFLLACLAGNLIEGFRVFTAPWFLALSSLLALSTAACTLEQVARVRRRARAGSAADWPAPREVRVPRPLEETASALGAVLRRMGLRVKRDGPRVRGELTVGRWSSPLFHLGLVLLFLSVVAGTLVQWTTTIVLSEGGTFDPAVQPLHSFTRSTLSRPPSPDNLPRITLTRYSPRYRWKGYSPDAASDLLVDGRRRLLRYGAPLTRHGLTLRQGRRYGALAEVVLRPAGARGATPESRPAAAGPAREATPPEFGGFFPLPEGGFRAGAVFVSQANAEEQRRLLPIPGTDVQATVRLLPGPQGTRYELPLDRRFELALVLSRSGETPAGEVRLRAGEALPVGPWELEFRSLRYWTTLTLTSSPLTPWFFALAWWCVLALGLGVLFPERRVEAELDPAPVDGTARPVTLVRYQVTAGRGAGLFPERLAEALKALEEVAR